MKYKDRFFFLSNQFHSFLLPGWIAFTVLLQIGQHSPSGRNGWAHVGFGHKILSQTTLPLKNKSKYSKKKLTIFLMFEK